MESRAFIREVSNVIREIADYKLAKNLGVLGDGVTVPDSNFEQKLQKKITQLFSEMTNPTLPSAYKLREVAISNGFHVDSRVSQKLDQHEIIWSM